MSHNFILAYFMPSFHTFSTCLLLPSLWCELRLIDIVHVFFVEPRRLYEEVRIEKHEEKTKGKENYPNEQFVLAKKAMKEQFNVICYRMQSLGREQSEGLLTQAAMYHMSQVYKICFAFFIIL